jgi:hypothetical protein
LADIAAENVASIKHSRRLHPAGGTDVEGDEPGLGLTPELQQRLSHVAEFVRPALAELHEAFEAAKAGSDTEERCGDAIRELEGLLAIVE